MSDRPLPRPVSNTDFYLAAILDALQKLAPAQPADGTDLVDLREPAKQYTPLPEDFPGRDALLAAGIDALEDVPRTGSGLTAVSGIGKVTANQILTYFTVNS